MAVQWNGDALLELVAKAAIEAVNETDDAVAARARERVHVVSGDLKNAIDTEPAKRVDKLTVEGSVGVDDSVRYGLIEEVTHPYLRPAYDSEAPSLGKRIAAKTQRQLK